MIKLLSKILRLLLVLIVVLAFSAFAYQRGWLKAHPLSAQIERWQNNPPQDWQAVKNIWQGNDDETSAPTETSFSFDQENLDDLSQNAGEQIKLMSERALEAGKVAKDFVANSVQVDETTDKNLSERAFEYGQYIYCKAVVNDWEKEATPSGF